MARKPRDAVQFTFESAERIADVVRAAELATPQGKPLTFEARFPDRMPKQVRAATFTGSWAINASKVVTFKYAPTATANVTNLSWPITHSHSVAENCIVGREGTSWWLVVPVLQAQTAVFVTQTQQRTYCSGTAAQSVVTGVSASTASVARLSDVSVTASLNTTNCTITVGVTKTTASTNVVTGVTASTATITVVSATATAVFIQQTATATYLQLRVP
jgi:hypothetical protein